MRLVLHQVPSARGTSRMPLLAPEAELALLQVEKGDVSGAIGTCKLVLRMGEHLFPVVRMSIHSMAIELLEDIVNRYPNYSEDYFKLLKELDKYEGHNAFVRSIKGERNTTGIIFKQVIYGTNSVTFRHIVYLVRPIFLRDFACYLQVMGDIISNSEVPYHEIIGKIQDFDERILKTIPLNRSLTRWFLPSFSSSMVSQAKSEARVRACKLGLALNVYKTNKGVYPESLHDLKIDILSELPVDPFTGKDFYYQKVGNGFIVYSIGKNLIDDSGESDQKSNKDDISWRCEK